jgi:predicted DNA-binding transcriptional regulator AlpA
MLRVLKKQLLKIVDDIDVGNSEISDEDAIQIADFLKRFNSRDKMISKYQAFTYLNISRAQFDNLVREGRLPKGKKIEGFKELQWSLKEIKDAKRRRNTDASERKQPDA